MQLEVESSGHSFNAPQSCKCLVEEREELLQDYAKCDLWEAFKK